MIISAALVGASAPFVEGLIAALGEHDRLWYGEHLDAPSPELAAVRYRPDLIGATITVLDAASLLDVGEGACGSISAAQYGWLRAHGQPAWLLVQRRAASLWHVVVRTELGTWDPSSMVQQLQRRRA